MLDAYTALMPIAPRPDTLFVHGKGSWLSDSEDTLRCSFCYCRKTNTRAARYRKTPADGAWAS